MGTTTSQLINDNMPQKVSYPEVYDIEDMVRIWVLHEYYQTTNPKMKKKQRRRLSSTQLFNMFVDYSGLNITHSQPVYGTPKNGQITENEIASSHFVNESYTSQQHNFSTKQKKTYAYTYSVDRGLTIGKTTQLKIKLPEDVLVDNVHLQEHVNIDQVGEDILHTCERELGMDHTLTIPALTKLTAHLFVTERQFTADFSIRSMISGSISVILKDASDKTVGEYKSNISNIIRDAMCNKEPIYNDEGEFIMLPCFPDFGGDNQFLWDVGKNQVYFQSRGYCSFCYLKKRDMKTDTQRINCFKLTVDRLLTKIQDF